MRAIIAEKPVPIAIEGKIRWRSHSQKPDESGAWPMAGNIVNAKIIISNIASQKSGIDNPGKAKIDTVLSAAVFFFIAEIIPAGKGIVIAIKNDKLANDNVLDKAS